MSAEWEASDYLWDPTTLVALRKASVPAEQPQLNSPVEKRQGHTPLDIVCQIEGCGVRLESPYYRVSLGVAGYGRWGMLEIALALAPNSFAPGPQDTI